MAYGDWNDYDPYNPYGQPVPGPSVVEYEPPIKPIAPGSGDPNSPTPPTLTGAAGLATQAWTRENVRAILSRYGDPSKMTSAQVQAAIVQAVKENPWLGTVAGNGKIKDTQPGGSGETWDVVGNFSGNNLVPGQPMHWQTLTGHTAAAKKTGTTSAQKLPPGTAPPGGKIDDGWMKNIFGDPKTWKVGMGFAISHGDIADSAIPAGWKRTGKGTFQYVGTGGTGGTPKTGTPNKGLDSWYTAPFERTFNERPYDPGSLWKEPTWDEVTSDPGYAFREKRLIGAAENNAASRGLLHSSGTIDNILSSVGDFAGQAYSDVRNRKLGGFVTNYGIGRDTYNTLRGNDWQRFSDEKDSWFRNRDSAFEKLYRISELGAKTSGA